MVVKRKYHWKRCFLSKVDLERQTTVLSKWFIHYSVTESFQTKWDTDRVQPFSWTKLFKAEFCRSEKKFLWNGANHSCNTYHRYKNVLGKPKCKLSLTLVVCCFKYNLAKCKQLPQNLNIAWTNEKAMDFLYSLTTNKKNPKITPNTHAH